MYSGRYYLLRNPRKRSIFYANILFSTRYPSPSHCFAEKNRPHWGIVFHGRHVILLDRNSMARLFSYQHVSLRRLLLSRHLSDQSHLPRHRLCRSLGTRSHVHHHIRILVRRGCQFGFTFRCLGLQCAPIQSARTSLSSLHHDMVFVMYSRRSFVSSVSPHISCGICAKILSRCREKPCFGIAKQGFEVFSLTFIFSFRRWSSRQRRPMRQ